MNKSFMFVCNYSIISSMEQQNVVLLFYLGVIRISLKQLNVKKSSTNEDLNPENGN